ncbi:MAG: MFS transporter [Chloroflexi bacterium]|nr:MFS transporter [Chloroflexota bacterium]MDL1944167.1 TCR/Tet family MFS transporter [Chloroflexi bacterium CFX2]
MPPSFFIILISVFVDMLGYGIMLPLLPFFVQAQDGGAAIAGGLMSMYSAIQLVSGPILGALSDRYGRKPILLLCLFGTAASYLLLGLANSLVMIFLAVFLDGLTGSNLTLAHAYIADSTTAENRAKGINYSQLAFGLGIMAGPILGGLLSGYGLSVPALVASFFAFANTVFGFFFLPESLSPERRETKPIAQVFSWAGQFTSIFRKKNIQNFLAVLFLLNLAFAGLQTNFPLFSNARFGWTPAQNSYFYLYVGLCGVIVQGVLFARLQAQFGERKLIPAGLTFMVIGLAGMAFAPDAWMIFPAVAVVALGTGISIPSLTALVSLRIPENEQGRLMGGNQTLLALTNIFGPTIAGISFDFVAISAPYWLGSVFALLAVGIWKMDDRRWTMDDGLSIVRGQ